MPRNTRSNGNRRRVRYAVVGLGYISQAAMLPAFAHAQENSELVALVSSDPKKLRDLARKYEVAHTYMYEQYADCLKSGAIDAVYIGLPNNMHRAYSEAAALAGVHVLCEKPMAFDEVECEAMIAAAEKTKVKLMIAYRLHFERGNLEMMETIKSGKIGEPRIFNSVFSQQAAAGNSRLDARVGGGPLYDMGVYCINAARYLFRAEPAEVFAWNLRPENDERFHEVPEMTCGLLQFPGDRVASFTSSFGAVDRSVYEVVGTKGAVKMDPAYDMAGDLKAEISIGGRTKKRVFKKRDQFAAELAYFSNCVLRDKQPEPSGREGLEDVRIVRALLQSAESGKPVSLSRVETDRRPEMSQEIAKAPVASPPKLVNAAPPAAN